MLTIALVGRPNVGKSSLFNRLLGYRRTIVFDKPGTTMDTVGEKVTWGNQPLHLVDSQGIFDEGDSRVIESLISKSDACLFVVDAATGPTPFDSWIAGLLKQARKPVLVLANKSDASRGNSHLDFSELGFENIIPVSAAHNRNVDQVKSWCLALQGETLPPGEPVRRPLRLDDASGEEGAEKPEDDAPLTLALVGRPNTGKSTLMNQLCRLEVSRVSPIPHTTRDPVSHELETPKGIVRLIDTAGIRRPRSKKDQIEVFSIQAATRTIHQADVVFLLIAAHEPMTDQDMRLLNLVEREGKPAAVLLNFWDRLNPSDRKKFLEDSEFSAYVSRFRTLPIAGLTGWNVDQALPLAFRLFKQAHRRVKTSKLNRIVENIILRNPPPTAGRQNFNILYASQVKVDPPTFVFFMNRKGNLPLSYQRYIENKLRSALGFRGTSLRVFFRGERDR